MSRCGRKNYIRRPDVVERIGSYLGTSFPLFHGHGARAILQINKFDVDTFAIMAKEAVSLVGEVCTLARQPATRQHTTERS